MSEIIVETKDRITRIEISRPEKKNALTPDMYAAMGQALRAADADPQVRAVLIHGQPDCFCAGNDMKNFLERPPDLKESPAWIVIRALAEAQKPLVAAVGGPAVGIGTTMLLHCDFVYAAPDAKLQLPFVPLGLVPEAGSSLLLPMLAGYQRAAELLLLGRPFTAEKAQAAGIVTEIVPAERLIAQARETAMALAALPAASVRATKRMMKHHLAAQLPAAMDEELRLFRERLAAPEAREAISAFLEKRKPDFSRFS